MRALLVLASLTIIIGCARYDYTSAGSNGVQQPVRVDRVSGQTQVLSSTRGWVPLSVKSAAPAPAPIPSSVPCTAEEIRLANTPPKRSDGQLIDYDHYLPERIQARMRQCRVAS